jgi:hypothetical protein
MELSILALNLIIILLAYLSIYPKLAGNSVNKIAFYDALTSGFALLVVGFNYWGSGYEFDLLIFDVNWFWFTIVTYFLIEIPIMVWYFKNQKVKL